MRRSSLFAAVSAVLLCSTSLSFAQTTPSDTVVARVGTEEIRASELNEAAQTLPEELRGMPAPVLYPMLLDQLVDRRIIIQSARKQGLDRDPNVQRQIARATDTALQNALLTREIAPTLTDEAIRAKYDRDVAGRTGEEEVRARHILVADEEAAKRITGEVKAGGDFAELAKTNSTDPGAQGGGDLGFFKKADMLPEFSDAAFALKPGEVTPASPLRRTSSVSRCSPPPTNASTAATARAALCAWCSPKRGRNRSW